LSIGVVAGYRDAAERKNFSLRRHVPNLAAAAFL